MGEKAKVGDRVEFWWENGNTIEGILESTPQDVGDSWVLIKDDGTIVHVVLYCSMTVLSRRYI